MNSALYLARRHPSLSQDELPQRWQQHSQLAGTLSALRGFFRGVSQCTRLEDSAFLPHASVDFDAVAIIYLHTVQSAFDIWELEESKTIMREDELKVFTRPVRESWLVCEELELRSTGEQADTVVFHFLSRHPSSEEEEFQSAIEIWEQETLRKSSGQPCRLVRNKLVSDPPAGFEYDCIYQTWFRTTQEAAAFYAESRNSPYSIGLLDSEKSLTPATQVTFSKP